MLDMDKAHYIQLGREHALAGISRYQAKRWCKVSLTIEQERYFWQGFNEATLSLETKGTETTDTDRLLIVRVRIE